MGETRGLEIEGYDPVNKNFVSSWYMDDGSTFSGVLTVSKNTYTYAGKFVVAGKQYLLKRMFTARAEWPFDANPLFSNGVYGVRAVFCA